MNNDDCKGGKMSKERVTVYLCGSMSGKLEKPVVIGKAMKPRCFKNLKVDKFPVTWKSNKRSWMTADIMKEWMLEFDRRMRIQKRHVLLFLDNAKCHPDINMKNVKIVKLPPNTTAACQPLDAGIIQNFKIHYKKLLMQNLVLKMNEAHTLSELSKSITLLDCIYWIAEAVKKVPPQTIQKCFRKVGFIKVFSLFNFLLKHAEIFSSFSTKLELKAKIK